MKIKFKKKTIVAICFCLLFYSIVKADGLDQAGDALLNILFKGAIILLLIILSLVIISNLRLNSILKILLIIWTFYTSLVYINDPRPNSFNMSASLGDLVFHPYGWAILSTALSGLSIWNNKKRNNNENYIDEKEIDVGEDI